MLNVDTVINMKCLTTVFSVLLENITYHKAMGSQY